VAYKKAFFRDGEDLRRRRSGSRSEGLRGVLGSNEIPRRNDFRKEGLTRVITLGSGRKTKKGEGGGESNGAITSEARVRKSKGPVNEG